MSLTTSSTAASSSTCAPHTFVTPPKDRACGVANTPHDMERLRGCCNGEPVIPYYNDCLIYCEAVDQSTDDIIHCLTGDDFDEDAEPVGFLCQSVEKVTPTTTLATNTAQPTSTASDAPEPNAASALSKGMGSKAGLAVCFMVIPAVFTGMFL